MKANALFNLGRTVATPGALAAGKNTQVWSVYVRTLLARHQSGDYGLVDEEDKRTNDRAITAPARILSAYPINPAKPSKGYGDNTLWIVTEADRSVTTVLLPEEY